MSHDIERLVADLPPHIFGMVLLVMLLLHLGTRVYHLLMRYVKGEVSERQVIDQVARAGGEERPELLIYLEEELHDKELLARLAAAA